MTQQTRTHRAACHCGTVRFNVTLPEDFGTVRRCTCSYCSMRGAVTLFAPRGDIEFVEGEDNVSLYQFNSGIAKHYFCKTCGIYTHHQRRSDPQQYGINAACLEGVSPFDFTEVTVMDGIRHPSENNGVALIAGILRFSAT